MKSERRREVKAEEGGGRESEGVNARENGRDGE